MNHKISGILNVLFHLIFISQLILLSGCGKEPNDWEIEYDEYIPGFHGESVRFNKPMVYLKVDSSFSNDGYTSEEIKIGLQLLAESTATALYKENHEFTPVTRNEYFKIENSFWVRKDWWTGIFAPDLHLVTFVDSNNVKSFSLFNIFALNSNRPEFDKYLYFGN